MLTDDVMARLAKLNRQSLPEEATRPTTKPRCRKPRRRKGRITLAEAAPGEEVQNAAGTHWLIRQPIAELWPDSQRHLELGERCLSAAANGQDPLHEELAALAGVYPHGAMYLDLETCGLAGSMVFLTGIVVHHKGQLVLEQLLARDYSEERSMLTAVWQSAAKRGVLITFNGKSFDWPMVHDRSTIHRLGSDERGRPRPSAAVVSTDESDVLQPDQPRPELVHFDLLHHARRRWKETLPDCKLQTLERFLCNRHRSGDIPGSEIPAAYHRFVRTGDANQMSDILHHNALDLVTLLQLSLRIAEPE